MGASWRGRYDRLRLNTCRRFSHLPNRHFAKGTPMFPSRDQLIENLERHDREDGIDLQLGTRVDRIERGDGGWVVHTSAGESSSAQVLVATGYQNEPLIPDWSGRDRFEGRLLHACEYRKPELFQAGGCSSSAPDAPGWRSPTTSPRVARRRSGCRRARRRTSRCESPGKFPGDVIAVALLHLPVRFADSAAHIGRRMDLGDLTEYGLPVPEEGTFARMRRLGAVPAIVDREVIDAIKAGRIEIVRGVESLDPAGAQLADGARVEPDAIICATGYRRGLEPLVGHLNVLGERGVPRALGEQPAAPGLRFIGYVPRPGALGYMGKEAKRAAHAIARELEQTEGTGRETRGRTDRGDKNTGASTRGETDGRDGTGKTERR